MNDDRMETPSVEQALEELLEWVGGAEIANPKHPISRARRALQKHREAKKHSEEQRA
jgi:hypothetical protein